MDEELGLLWPKKLMDEISHRRMMRPWAGVVSIACYGVMSLLSVLVGLIQLVLVVVSNNPVMVREGYYPTVLRISLIISGVVAAVSVAALVRLWFEQATKMWAILMLNAGTMLMGLVIWLVGFGLPLEAHQLTPLLLLVMVGAGVGAIILKKYDYDAGDKRRIATVLAAVLAVMGVTETTFSLVYLLNQRTEIDKAQQALEELGQRQAAAHVNGVSSELSALVFTLCDGAYDVVQMVTGSESDGIFECRESAMVYSVAGPTQPVAPNAHVINGAAFYFGKVNDETVNNYFTPEMNVKYIYRDLSGVEDTASELILLVPAASDEIAINKYLGAVTGFVNAVEDDLRLTIFYTPETNGVITTKDFILIAAADTLANVSYLPDGSSRTGYLNGEKGTYLYSADGALNALKELGQNPTWYSSQTLDALTNRPHIGLMLEGDKDYTEAELREMMYDSLRDPVGTDTNANYRAEEDKGQETSE